MGDPNKYAEWIVQNQDKKGTREFEIVANAYREARKSNIEQIDINGPQVLSDNPVKNFLAGVGKGMTDVARGAGQYVGAVSREDIEKSRALDAPLSSSGAGSAGEIVGQIATALPAMFVPGANTVIGGGLVGAGIGALQPSSSTGETLTNVAFGLGGGSAGVLAGRALPKVFGSLIAPFTSGGRDKIAGNVLREFADGAVGDVINAAISPEQFVKGSLPTLAEVAQKPGISTLQNAIKGVSPTVSNALSERATNNLMARTDAIRSIAGTADDLAMRKNARSVLSKLFYKSAENTKVPVTLRDRAISEIMERPSMQAAWANAERLARESGVKSVTAKGEITGASLHFLKTSLDDQIGEAVKAGRNADASFLQGTKNALQSWMEKNIPDYKMARATFAELSKPINELEVGKYLLNKLQPALMEGSKTPTRETASSFANALRDAPKTIKSASGMSFNSLDEVMRPDSAEVVRGVFKDLQRKATSDDLARTIGSNTAQNLASQQVLRNIMGPLGLPKSWVESEILKSAMRPVQFAMKGPEGRIQDVLGKALLEPEFAAKLMIGAAENPMGLLGRTYSGVLAPAASSGLLSYSR